MGPTLNDRLPKLTNTEYMPIIDASSVYHNLKLNKKSLYLTMFACQFIRYRFTRLPFGVAPAGVVFQPKINKVFKVLPNVFHITDDVLIVGYDANGRDHDRTLRCLIQLYCSENLKLKK